MLPAVCLRSNSLGTVQTPETMIDITAGEKVAMARRQWLNQITGTAETLLGAAFVQIHQDYRKHEHSILIDGGLDESFVRSKRPVRLLGFHNAHSSATVAKGLVLLLHGWEGSSHASDTLTLGAYLYRHGYETVRLNLRDHGPTHGLNEGVFNGGLLSEVNHAIAQIATLRPQLPIYIVGSSLGGNFALRIAAQAGTLPTVNLRKIVAICPAIDPHVSTQCIDGNPVFRNYFRRRFLRSLKLKQQHFPEHYELKSIASLRTIEQMTHELCKRYIPAGSMEAYFDSYTLTRERLGRMRIPAVIVAAQNDPVIPIQHIQSLSGLPNLTLDVKPWGGHTAFVQPIPLTKKLPALVLNYLAQG